MVCQFLLYNKVNQLYVYIYPHIPSLLRLPPTLPVPPLQVVTKHRADLPVLCGCFPLAIYFTFGSVYKSMPLSHFVPAYPSPSPCPQVHSLCLAHSFFKKLFIYLFIYFWLCWVFVSARGLSLVAASGGHPSSQCAGLSLSRPLLLRSTGSRRAGSVAVAHGPSCSVACGILPDQGLNPCPLHQQADSQPLRHQGSPCQLLYCKFYQLVWQDPILILFLSFSWLVQNVTLLHEV